MTERPAPFRFSDRAFSRPPGQARESGIGAFVASLLLHLAFLLVLSVARAIPVLPWTERGDAPEFSVTPIHFFADAEGVGAAPAGEEVEGPEGGEEAGMPGEAVGEEAAGEDDPDEPVARIDPPQEPAEPGLLPVPEPQSPRGDPGDRAPGDPVPGAADEAGPGPAAGGAGEGGGGGGGGRRTAAELLRPPPPDLALLGIEIPELSEEERYRLALEGRLERWQDSVAAEIIRGTPSLDWTHTDGEGRRWGVSPGKLHLGRFTLPLPFNFAPPPDLRGDRARRAFEDEDIRRGARTGAVRDSWNERNEAIRTRREQERADSIRAVGGGG